MFFTPVLQATGIRKFNRAVGNTNICNYTKAHDNESGETAVTHKSLLHRTPDDIQSPQDILLQFDTIELFQQRQASPYYTYWLCSCTEFI
jgi:hypothetical protein